MNSTDDEFLSMSFVKSVVMAAADQLSNQNRNRPIILERQVPAKMIAGDDNADTESPDVENAEGTFEGMVSEILILFLSQCSGSAKSVARLPIRSSREDVIHGSMQ